MEPVEREVTTTSKFTTGDGEEYISVSKTVWKAPTSNGLSDVLIAAIGFSTVGVIICLSWAAVINLTRPPTDFRQYNTYQGSISGQTFQNLPSN